MQKLYVLFDGTWRKNGKSYVMGTRQFWSVFGQGKFWNQPEVSTTSGSKVMAQIVVFVFSVTLTLTFVLLFVTRTANLRFARPVGRCPRSYMKCLLVLRRQWSFRQSRHMPGQLRPMTRRRRGRVRFSTVGSHLYCRCRYRFYNSLTRILCRLLSGLRWSQLSHIHHPQSHTLPRPVLICTLSLPSVPGRVTVIFRFRRSGLTASVSVWWTPVITNRPIRLWNWVGFSRWTVLNRR